MKINTTKLIGIFVIFLMIGYTLLSVDFAENVEEQTIESIEEIASESETIDERILPNDVEIGDTVIYGNYYDINDEETKVLVPLKWDVIDKKNNFVLLITDDIIENIKYNATWNAINWEDSSVRKWLNESFYNTAFTEKEKKFIKETEVINADNDRYFIEAGPDTKDKVFILCLDDMEKYFSCNAARQAKGTKYAINDGLWVSRYSSSVGYSVWWLRTPGRTMSRASLVHAGGAAGEFGDGVATIGNGVRPCIWVETME